jgi:epoxyqueuosine reductase
MFYRLASSSALLASYRMDAVLKTRWICDRARAVGFDLCGVVSIPAAGKNFDELQHLPEWLNRGHAGEMNYLHDPRRADPALAMNGARSLIVAALNYNSAQPYSTEAGEAFHGAGAPRGWISRYAWGDDYHEVLWDKLNSLVAAMHAHWPEPFDARAYVDTGPIIERVAAKHAGLGWLAKNTCLINQEIGSWLFLGVIITTLDLAPSLSPQESPAPDRCGTCTLCLDACPTNAFSEPYVLDARRCISYLTIELRAAIPEGLRPALGNAAIGCDICQDVCPWNRKSPVTTLAAFQPRAVDNGSNVAADRLENGKEKRENGKENFKATTTLFAPKLEWLASLTQQQFSATFRRSAVKRAKWRGLVRNACVALGNSNLSPEASDYPRIIALLEDLAAGSDELIAEHAQWALARLKN